jgi:FKBP-type peptidyl-prolyl cis-trans isomerase
LLIPADKAYGANPPQGIPANADLVFDITLHKIGQ